MTNDEVINIWKDELIKDSKVSLSKEIIIAACTRLDEIKDIIKTGEISAIISFISLLLSSRDESIEDKTNTMQQFANSLISSLCLSMIPITGLEKRDKIFAKYREKLFVDVFYSLHNNINAASEELQLVEGESSFVFPTTTVH